MKKQIRKNTKQEGIDLCVTCSTSLQSDEIGYCQKCLKSQEFEKDHLQGIDQIQLHRYAERKRGEIIEFLDPKRFNIKYIDRSKINTMIDKKIKVHGILSPILASSLDYSLIWEVKYINKITKHRIKWLIDYWVDKYEIDLDDLGKFDHEVGLVFWGYSEYHDYEYSNTYDYPDCLVQAYVSRNLREIKNNETTRSGVK